MKTTVKLCEIYIKLFQDIEESHPGRPDLDYDETPVGPAPTECTEEKND